MMDLHISIHVHLRKTGTPTLKLCRCAGWGWNPGGQDLATQGRHWQMGRRRWIASRKRNNQHGSESENIFGGATLQPAVAQVFRCMFIHHGASLPDLVLAADCQPRRDTIGLQASGFTGDWISFEHHFCRSLFQVTRKRWKDWDLDSQPLHVAAYQRATCNVCNIQF